MADLAILFAALDRLHSSLNTISVLNTIQELLVNVVGAEQYAVVQVDRRTFALTPLALAGFDEPHAQSFTREKDAIVRLLHKEELFIAGEADTSFPGASASGLNACIPLKIEGVTIAAIVILRLVAHKGRLVPFDRDLLRVLATHGATALYASSLHDANLQLVVK